MRKLAEINDGYTRDKYVKKYHMEYLFADSAIGEVTVDGGLKSTNVNSKCDIGARRYNNNIITSSDKQLKMVMPNCQQQLQQISIANKKLIKDTSCHQELDVAGDELDEQKI